MEQSRSQPAGERIALEGEAAVVVRPLEPADADLVQAVFDRMGEDARYLRFLGHKKRLSRRDVEVLTGIDHHGHEALVALDAEGGMAVGVARMIRYARRPEVAEVAVSVVDDWQGRGLGSALLERLVERAREEGVERFKAVLIARNQAMLHLFERLGAVRILSRQADNIEVEIDLPVAAGAPQDLLRVAASASRGSSATGADQP